MGTASPGSRHLRWTRSHKGPKNPIPSGRTRKSPEAYRWGPGTPNHESFEDWLGRSTPDSQPPSNDNKHDDIGTATMD